MLPTLYLDECVDISLVVPLHDRGIAARTAHDEQMLTASNADQLSFATSRGWLIVTHNQRDFVRLHATRTHSGIVCLPAISLDRVLLRLVMMLVHIRQQSEHTNRLNLWRDTQASLIGGERLAGFSEDDVRRALGQG